MVAPYECHSTERDKSGRDSKERLLVHDILENNDVGESKAHVTEENPCPECGCDHGLANCKGFLSMSTKSRSENRNDKEESPAKTGGSETSEFTVFFHERSTTKALFRYIPVTLYNNSRSIDVYALIDEGASCTLIERSLADELGLGGPEEQLCLKCTSDVTQSESKSKIVSACVSAEGRPEVRHVLKGVRTVRNLYLPLQSIDDQTLKERRHLSTVPISTYKDTKAQIIIGLDNIKISVPLEVRQAEDDDLIAVRCKLGWAVYGRQGPENDTPPRVLHICHCTTVCGTRKLDEAMKAFFSLESFGVNIPKKPLRSKEDEHALKIMEATTK
ncbi:uncharacterized protein [Drosophila takahashii]|uniref:uncharacterized protein n=1 Tax=Drosophila takahashii TaxID=29030 RepID=UPI0038995344